MSPQHAARIRVGTSGWAYPAWRGAFYPEGLVQRRELDYLAHRLNSAEINASFYSLQRPERYRNWAEQTPDDFVFSVKGSRFITHMKRLREVETPLANFLASGVLALGHRLGPMLWQLPPALRWEPELLEAFFSLLPRSTAEAAALARRHDHRVDERALTTVEVDQPLRHALEVRHPSFASPDAIELLRAHDIALVLADTAGTWPYIDDLTTDFVYVRLHGDLELYASGYTTEALAGWASLIRSWHAGSVPTSRHTVAEAAATEPGGRDVYVYFDNDVKAHAPHDALALAERCPHD
jgi:uncharacterized protein YecE (DUF72 family)